MSLPRFAWNAYLAYHLRGQARVPFWPLKVIEHRQSRRVRTMVSHAYHTVPYYRRVMDRLGLGSSDFQCAEDLSKLPLLERTQPQRDPESFVSTVHRLDRCLKLRTGGSTGVPCTIYHATAALFQNAAQGERERSMVTPLVGRSFGYREAVIGSPATMDKVVQEFCQARSTLDHFGSSTELGASLHELHQVLKTHGLLSITLDNRANPIVALRYAVPFPLLNRLGIVPYYVGATCGPRGLRHLLQQSGFQICETSVILHCLRVIAVLTARLLKRYAGTKMQRHFLQFLMSFERLSCWPTRFLIGHFVAVRALKC